jgi:hypothetical protein
MYSRRNIIADSYVKYAHKLSREMNALGLHIEGANALLLIANLLQWSNEELDELHLGGELSCNNHAQASVACEHSYRG